MACSHFEFSSSVAPNHDLVHAPCLALCLTRHHEDSGLIPDPCIDTEMVSRLKLKPGVSSSELYAFESSNVILNVGSAAMSESSLLAGQA